jgi:glucokinase
MTVPAVLAVDIGGTKMAAAMAGLRNGRLGPVITTMTPRGSGDDVWESLAGLIHACTGGAGGGPAAVGVGCPGPMNTEAGTVSPVNIPGWRGFPLQARITEFTGAPTVLANDACCAALGEYRHGAGRGATSMLGIVVSTGVGGGLVLDGRLYQGPTGNAGHLGHAVADPGGDPCPCGGRGCVETLASGPSMVRRALQAGWRGPPGATAADLARAAAAGSPEALEAFDRAGRALATGIVWAAALADLDAAVIGGGVASAGDLILKPTSRHFRRYAGLSYLRRLRIVLTSLRQPEAALLGAASLAAGGGPLSRVRTARAGDETRAP